MDQSVDHIFRDATDVCQGFAEVLRLVKYIRIEERFAYNPERKPHHFVGYVND
jgi:hypothetical protein